MLQGLMTKINWIALVYSKRQGNLGCRKLSCHKQTNKNLSM